MRASITHYELAIGHSPEYAPAYAAMADSYVMLACRGMVPPRRHFGAHEPRLGKPSSWTMISEMLTDPWLMSVCTIGIGTVSTRTFAGPLN